MWLCSLALALPSIDTPLPSDQAHPGDTAVVVGIEDYVFLPDVPHAAADADAAMAFLTASRGIPSDRVTLLTAGSREQILAAVDAAAGKTAPGDTVWIYLAGHGAAAPTDGRRLFLGDDTRPDPAVFEARSIGIDDLQARATAGGALTVTLVDACFNGRGRTGDDLTSGTRLAVPTYAVEPPEGSLVWTASGPEQLARPLDAAGHGAFTYLALGALRGWADGAVDGRIDGVVTAAEAQRYVQQGLRDLGIADQTPSQTGDTARRLAEAVSEPAPELSEAVTEGFVTVSVPNGYDPGLVAAAAGFGVVLPLDRGPFGVKDAAGNRVRRQRLDAMSRATVRGRRGYRTRNVGLAMVVPGFMAGMGLGSYALYDENLPLGLAALGSMAVGFVGTGLVVGGATAMEAALEPDFRPPKRP